MKVGNFKKTHQIEGKGFEPGFVYAEVDVTARRWFRKETQRVSIYRPDYSSFWRIAGSGARLIVESNLISELEEADKAASLLPTKEHA